jgi:hypothetical protein
MNKIEKVYLKFNKPDSPDKKFSHKGFGLKMFNKIFSKRLKKIEDKYQELSYWKVEFDKEINCTTKELGFDKNGRAICGAPTKRERGLWTDEDYKLSDYEKFSPTFISKEEFEKDWNGYFSLNN